jgi:hypothetical protein
MRLSTRCLQRAFFGDDRRGDENKQLGLVSEGTLLLKKLAEERDLR